MTNFIYHLCVKSKRMIQINLLTKPKQTHRHRKETFDYQRERDILGVWD